MNKCRVCGVEIPDRKTYCSSKCKEKHRYDNTLYEKICDVCGKKFVGKKGMTKCSEECSLKSQRKHEKECPMCKTKFNSRGNGIYCSEVCYRTANSATKGLMVTSCEVCSNSFRTPITSPELVCSDICSSKLFQTYIDKANQEVFGTTNLREIKAKIKQRSNTNEK